MSKTNPFKTNGGVKSKENSPRHRNIPKQDSPLMLMPHGRATADPLVLDLILPTNQHMSLTFDPFSTFADLTRAIASLLTLRGSNRVTLSRRVGRMKGWEIIDIADHETLIGKICNHETYRVNVVENSSGTLDTEVECCPWLDEFNNANNGRKHPCEQHISFPYQAYHRTDSFDDVYALLPQTRVTRENEDEEFAMRLQENECLAHHEKIELEKNCPVQPRSITPPLTFGEVMLRGTLSQYTAGKGESACTSIALVAAKHLLVNCKWHTDPLEYTDATILDAIVQIGVKKYGMAAPGHCNLEDIWSLPVFEDTVESLKLGQRIEDRVGFEGFNRVIEYAWAFAENEESKSKAVAVIITKPPVTLLCFSCTGSVWYLLDSHGENYATNKVTYLMQFKSTMNLALELEGKFPSLSGAEHDLNLAMYNSFEATPILATVSGNKSIVQSDTKPAARAVAATTTTPITENSLSRKQSSSLQSSSLLDLSRFQCPCTLHVMADPVVTDDGHTYDRSSIEQHFQTRRDEEQKRLNELLGATKDVVDSSSCCGGPRPPIELTSPMTGVVISDRLVPNRFVEEQIVALVESNAIEMTEDELADWRQRRLEKREKDRERVEQDRRILEEQERMRKNRQEAEKLRADEAATGSTSVSSSENTSMLPSQLVSVDRYRGQRIGPDDLGISTALCDETSWVEIDYVRSQNEHGNIRCMLPCCARLISPDGVSWCCRCGRIACTICLVFQVTDISKAESKDLHRICGECVMQILDVMPRDGALGQTRANLMKLRLQPYLSTLSTRAIDAQDMYARQSAEASFAADIRNIEHDIQELRNTRETLLGQLKVAESRANEAMLDDGATGTRGTDISDEDDEVIQWEEVVTDLQQQYDEVMRQSQDQGMDEDAQFLHFQAVSDISFRLEEAQSSLAEIRSRNTGNRTEKLKDNTVGTSDGLSILPPETNADMCVADLQCTCETLQRLHDRLQAGAIPDNANAFLSRTQAISTVLSRFDQAQAHLLEARNRLDTRLSSFPSSLQHLADLISQFVSQARSVCSACPPTAPMKPRGFRRLFSSTVRDPEATTLDPTVLEQLNALFGAGQNCLQATNSPGSRMDCIKVVLNELNQLSVNVGSMNSQAQSLHRNAVQHAMNLYNETTHTIECQREEKQQIHEAFNRVPRGEKPANEMNFEELQNEFLQLSNAVEGMTDPDEITVAMMRLTEIEQVVLEIQYERAVIDIQSTFMQEETSVSSQVCAVVTETGFLSAIGYVDEDWPLPLGLKYPTTYMQNEIELLRNTLADRMIQSEREYDSEFSEKLSRLNAQKEELEDEVQGLQSRVENAEASAEEEQHRLEQRRERHRQEEARRRERERRRLEEESRLRREREELVRKNAADEAKTMEALRNAVGREDNARAFGGQGDFRMCRICKAGESL